MYNVYVSVDIDGESIPMVFLELESIGECASYIKKHREEVKEIIIEDDEDYCVFHLVDNVIIHPKGLE